MRYRLPLASIATTYCLIFLFALYLAQGKTIGLHFDWRVMLVIGAVIALKSLVSIVYLIVYMRDPGQHVPMAAWGSAGIPDVRSQEVFIQVEEIYSLKGSCAEMESGKWLCGVRLLPALYLEILIHILLACVVILGAVRYLNETGFKLDTVLGSGGEWAALEGHSKDRFLRGHAEWAASEGYSDGEALEGHSEGEALGGKSSLNGVNIRITELIYGKPGSLSKIVLQAKMSDGSLREFDLQEGDGFMLNGVGLKYASEIIISNLKVFYDNHDFMPLPTNLVRASKHDKWFRGEIGFSNFRARGNLKYKPDADLFSVDINIDDDKFLKRDVRFAEVIEENGFRVYVPTMMHGARITTYRFIALPFMKGALLLLLLTLIVRISLRPKFVESGLTENGERWVRTNDRKVLRMLRGY